MMKKIIAILLSLALLLGCMAATAEETEKQTFGALRINGEFTLKGVLADGYQVVPFNISDEALLARIVSDDPERPEMILSIAYDETYSHVDRLNDLDDEDLAILEQTFTDTDPYVNITYDETAYGTRLMVARTTTETYDYLDFFTIYKGYFVEFVMYPGRKAAKQHLTDEQVASCNAFLSELDFVEGIEAAEVEIEGKTFEASINEYDKDARSIGVTLLKPVTMTEQQAASLKEGNTIHLGAEEIEIATLENMDGDVIINGEYDLLKSGDGVYSVIWLNLPVMEEIKSMTLKVPDTLVFEEDVDPEFGNMLDEPRLLTADDLFSALEASEEDFIRFDSQNVRITFDENGEASRIERYYSPVQ